jgi:hypothetical protein
VVIAEREHEILNDLPIGLDRLTTLNALRSRHELDRILMLVAVVFYGTNQLWVRVCNPFVDANEESMATLFVLAIEYVEKQVVVEPKDVAREVHRVVKINRKPLIMDLVVATLRVISMVSIIRSHGQDIGQGLLGEVSPSSIALIAGER